MITEKTRQKMRDSHKGQVAWNRGIPMSEETKNKVSAAKKINPTRYWKGKKFSIKHRENLSSTHKGQKSWNKGRKGIYSEVTKLKMSEAHKGKKLTEEAKMKLSEANKGEKHPFFNKKHSEESRKKIRDARANYIFTPEHKAAISNGMKGKNTWSRGSVATNETRKKLSIALKGKKRGAMTEEQKRKISEAKTGTKLSIEHRRKIGLTQSGERSRWWRGGITPLYRRVRNTLEAKFWRDTVFKRDAYTCIQCGDDRGGNLNADHIKPFADIFSENNIQTFEMAMECKELWDVNNGRTLCVDCHKKAGTYGKPRLKKNLIVNNRELQYV